MVQVSCTMASGVYVFCTLRAVLCIPSRSPREYIKLHSGYKSHVKGVWLPIKTE